MHGSIVAAAARAAAAVTPEVTTSLGSLHGGVCQNQNIHYYHSIPYAQPPTGDLRFQPPKSYTQKFSGSFRNATTEAPACPQFGSNGAESGKTAEDCLYINVWKPAKTDAKSNLPVRVFVHGGGNMAGGIADPKYDGCNVAQDNVMVSINYRLGPLGFLALEDAGLNGNQGIEDIVMGLQWVQDNIHAFGGNPKEVLLHGQSNGAADAYSVATLDYAPKLMNAFISQSGAGRDLASVQDAAAASKNFAQALKCDTKDLKCFQKKTLDDITKTVGDAKSIKSDALIAATESGSKLSFGAHIDGKFFAKQPNDVGVKVPSIFGVNSDEGTYFAQAYATGPKGLAGTTDKDYEKFLNDHFGANAKKIEQQYPISNFKKTPFPPYYAISQVITDSAFLCPAERALKAAADKKVPVWSYHFQQKPHCAWDTTDVPEKDRSYMGATHGAEMPYVLGMTSQLPRPGGNCQMDDADQKITAFMKQSFTYFAATRKPTNNGNSWPEWTSKSSLGLIVQDGVKAGQNNYSACKFWDDLHTQATASKPKDDDKPKTTTTISGKPTTITGSTSSKPTTTTTNKPSSKPTTTTTSTTGAPSSKAAPPSSSQTTTTSQTSQTSSTGQPLLPTSLGNGNGTADNQNNAQPPKPSDAKNDPLTGAASANSMSFVAVVVGAMAVLAI